MQACLFQQGNRQAASETIHDFVVQQHMLFPLEEADSNQVSFFEEFLNAEFIGAKRAF
jgi:hypothetical protein